MTDEAGSGDLGTLEVGVTGNAADLDAILAAVETRLNALVNQDWKVNVTGAEGAAGTAAPKPGATRSTAKDRAAATKAQAATDAQQAKEIATQNAAHQQSLARRNKDLRNYNEREKRAEAKAAREGTQYIPRTFAPSRSYRKSSPETPASASAGSANPSTVKMAANGGVRKQVEEELAEAFKLKVTVDVESLRAQVMEAFKGLTIDVSPRSATQAAGAGTTSGAPASEERPASGPAPAANREFSQQLRSTLANNTVLDAKIQSLYRAVSGLVPSANLNRPDTDTDSLGKLAEIADHFGVSTNRLVETVKDGNKLTGAAGYREGPLGTTALMGRGIDQESAVEIAKQAQGVVRAASGEGKGASASTFLSDFVEEMKSQPRPQQQQQQQQQEAPPPQPEPARPAPEPTAPARPIELDASTIATATAEAINEELTTSRSAARSSLAPFKTIKVGDDAAVLRMAENYIPGEVADSTKKMRGSPGSRGGRARRPGADGTEKVTSYGEEESGPFLAGGNMPDDGSSTSTPGGTTRRNKQKRVGDLGDSGFLRIDRTRRRRLESEEPSKATGRDPEADIRALEQLGSTRANVRREINWGALQGNVNGVPIDLRGAGARMGMGAMRGYVRDPKTGEYTQLRPEGAIDSAAYGESQQRIGELTRGAGLRTIPGMKNQVEPMSAMDVLKRVVGQQYGEEGAAFIEQPSVQAELRKLQLQGGARAVSSVTTGGFENINTADSRSLLGDLQDREAIKVRVREAATASMEATGVEGYDPELIERAVNRTMGKLERGIAAKGVESGRENKARVENPENYPSDDGQTFGGLTRRELAERKLEEFIPTAARKRIESGSLPNFNRPIERILEETEAGGYEGSKAGFARRRLGLTKGTFGLTQLLTRGAGTERTGDEIRQILGNPNLTEDETNKYRPGMTRDDAKELGPLIRAMGQSLVAGLEPGPGRKMEQGGGMERTASFAERDINQGGEGGRGVPASQVSRNQPTLLERDLESRRQKVRKEYGDIQDLIPLDIIGINKDDPNAARLGTSKRGQLGAAQGDTSAARPSIYNPPAMRRAVDKELGLTPERFRPDKDRDATDRLIDARSGADKPGPGQALKNRYQADFKKLLAKAMQQAGEAIAADVESQIRPDVPKTAMRTRIIPPAGDGSTDDTGGTIHEAYSPRDEMRQKLMSGIGKDYQRRKAMEMLNRPTEDAQGQAIKTVGVEGGLTRLNDNYRMKMRGLRGRAEADLMNKEQERSGALSDDVQAIRKGEQINRVARKIVARTMPGEFGLPQPFREKSTVGLEDTVSPFQGPVMARPYGAQAGSDSRALGAAQQGRARLPEVLRKEIAELLEFRTPEAVSTPVMGREGRDVLSGNETRERYGRTAVLPGPHPEDKERPRFSPESPPTPIGEGALADMERRDMYDRIRNAAGGGQNDGVGVGEGGGFVPGGAPIEVIVVGRFPLQVTMAGGAGPASAGTGEARTGKARKNVKDGATAAPDAAPGEPLEKASDIPRTRLDPRPRIVYPKLNTKPRVAVSAEQKAIERAATKETAETAKREAELANLPFKNASDEAKSGERAARERAANERREAAAKRKIASGARRRTLDNYDIEAAFQDREEDKLQKQRAGLNQLNRLNPKRGFTASVTDLATSKIGGGALERQQEAIARATTEAAELRRLRLAKADFLGKGAIRLQERQAITLAAPRDAAGVRQFTPEQTARLGVINAELKQFGTSLKEINPAIVRSTKMFNDQVKKGTAPGTVAKSFAAAGVGATIAGGAGALTVGLGIVLAPVIQGAVEGIVNTLGSALERLSGGTGTAGRVQTELGAATLGVGGRSEIAFAQSRAQTGLGPRAAALIEEPITQRAQIEAGNLALVGQVDQFRASQKFRDQNKDLLGDAALSKNLTGALGLSIGGTPSAEESITNLFQDVPRGYAGQSEPSEAQKAERQRLAGQVSALEKSFEAVGGGATMDNPFAAGLIMAQANLQSFDESLGGITDRLNSGGDALDFFNAQATDAGANIRVQPGGGQTPEDRAVQVQALFAARLNRLAQQVKDEQISITDDGGKAITDPQALNDALTKYVTNAPKPSPDALLDAQKDQIKASEQTRQLRSEINLGTLSPAQRGVGSAQEGDLKLSDRPEAGFTEKTRKLYDELNTNAAKNRAKAVDFVTKGPPELRTPGGRPFERPNAGLGAEKGEQFSKALENALGYSNQIADIQVGLETKNAALAADQYAYSIGIAKRSLNDAKALIGDIAGGTSNLGAIERENFMLSRQSQSLGLELSQRQINFQRAAANFQSPGETSEERAGRKEAAKAEADYAQKQLDIQKKLFALGGKAFEVGGRRQVDDLEANLGFMGRTYAIQIETTQANKEIAGLLKKRDKELVAVNQLFSDAQEKTNEMVTLSHDLVVATGEDLGKIATDVVNAYVKVYKDLTTAITDSLTPQGQTDRESYQGTHGSPPPETNALGRVGMVNGATAFGSAGVMGEAGGEAFAILRDPQKLNMTPYQGGQGGNQSISIVITGNTVRNDGDIDEIARKVEVVLNRRGAQLGLRPFGG